MSQRITLYKDVCFFILSVHYEMMNLQQNAVGPFTILNFSTSFSDSSHNYPTYYKSLWQVIYTTVLICLLNRYQYTNHTGTKHQHTYKLSFPVFWNNCIYWTWLSPNTSKYLVHHKIHWKDVRSDYSWEEEVFFLYNTIEPNKVK